MNIHAALIQFYHIHFMKTTAQINHYTKNACDVVKVEWNIQQTATALHTLLTDKTTNRTYIIVITWGESIVWKDICEPISDICESVSDICDLLNILRSAENFNKSWLPRPSRASWGLGLIKNMVYY